MTTIAELFHAAGVSHAGAVPWGEPAPLDMPGVYVVGTTPDVAEESAPANAAIDSAQLAALVRSRPELAIDGAKATMDALTDRLQRMWVPNEPAVYVGLASGSVRARVDQFYRTAIGARAPHAGGWPIKMLDTAVMPLWIHFGPAQNPEAAEIALAERFMEGVTADVRNVLVDPSTPLPYANLMVPHGRRKRHGIRGAKAPKSVTASAGDVDTLIPAPSVSVAASGVLPKAAATTTRSRRTQTITEADIRSGRVRVPSASKDILPVDRAQITVDVNGVMMSARWDPRTQGNRSGVIGLGRQVMREQFTAGGQRQIFEKDGYYTIA